MKSPPAHRKRPRDFERLSGSESTSTSPESRGRARSWVRTEGPCSRGEDAQAAPLGDRAMPLAKCPFRAPATTSTARPAFHTRLSRMKLLQITATLELRVVPQTLAVDDEVLAAAR